MCCRLGDCLLAQHSMQCHCNEVKLPENCCTHQMRKYLLGRVPKLTQVEKSSVFEYAPMFCRPLCGESQLRHHRMQRLHVHPLLTKRRSSRTVASWELNLNFPGKNTYL